MPARRDETFVDAWLRIAAGGIRPYELARLLGCSRTTASRLMRQTPPLGAVEGDKRPKDVASDAQLREGILRQLTMAARNQDEAYAADTASKMSLALRRLADLDEAAGVTEEDRLLQIQATLSSYRKCTCGPMAKPPEPNHEP